MPHQPYTALDHYWPIQLEPDKLLVQDPWHRFAERIYNCYKRCSAIVGGAEFSTDFFDQLELPDLPAFPVEVGGLGVTVFVIRAVVYAAIWAARQGIELSKFELHTGGFGVSGIGWTPMGAVLYREC